MIYGPNMLFRSTLQLSTRRSFQSSARRALTIPFLPTLPQKPGGVIGTPNDPHVAPAMNKAEGSVHWWTEKVFAVSALPLATTAFLTSGGLSTTTDTIFALSLLGYSYMEFQSCITDYIPKRVYGKFHDYALYLLGAGSVISLLGIYKLEKDNDGVTGFIRSAFSWKQEGAKVTATEAEQKKI